VKPAPRQCWTPIAVRIAAPISFALATIDVYAVRSSTSPHWANSLYSPELRRLIVVMGLLMPRTFDDPTSSPCALQIILSQHISTLPNTSGMHILGGEHAQVKHSL
jgi:hypothetical protein